MKYKPREKHIRWEQATATATENVLYVFDTNHFTFKGFSTAWLGHIVWLEPLNCRDFGTINHRKFSLCLTRWNWMKWKTYKTLPKSTEILKTPLINSVYCRHEWSISLQCWFSAGKFGKADKRKRLSVMTVKTVAYFRSMYAILQWISLCKYLCVRYLNIDR